MGKSILALCVANCMLCVLPARAERTPEQVAGDLAALTNRILRLEHGDDMLYALPRWAEREGLSKDELSRTLVLVAEAFRGATNREDRFARECAVDALGFCGTTNAIPFLESLVRSETGATFDTAMNALMVLTKADPGETEAIRRIVTEDRRSDPGPLYGFYREMAHVLKWRNLDPDRATAIRTVLLDTAGKTTDWSEVADEILCAHVSGYARSGQRKENLERALATAKASGKDGAVLERAVATLSAPSEEAARTAPDPSVEFGPKYPEPARPPGE